MALQRNLLLSKSEVDLFDKIKSGDLKGVLKCLTDHRTRQKININCSNENGCTPLYVAIDGGKIRDVKRMIKLLLDHGAQINIRNFVGQTVIYHACEYWFGGTADIINVLLQNGGKPNMEALNKCTPLHVACKVNYVAAARSLILYNADANCRDIEGETPLMHASRACRIDGEKMILLLLENSALINLQNLKGQTALHIACQYEDHIIVAMLLRHGADTSIRDNIGRTPLHCACLDVFLNCGHKPMKMLLDYNADTNGQDNNGNTPLHVLVARILRDEQFKCLRKLFKHNADFNIKNDVGENPLLTAVQICGDNLDVVEIAVYEFLLMVGSDINVQRLRWNGSIGSRLCESIRRIKPGVIGDTPLHVAVRHNNVQLVHIILKYNPDFHIFNNNKHTALDLAKDLGHDDIIACIEGHIHKKRCQMYTFYHETWCHQLADSPNNIKSIAPVEIRKRKQYSYREKRNGIKNAKRSK